MNTSDPFFLAQIVDPMDFNWLSFSRSFCISGLRFFFNWWEMPIQRVFHSPYCPFSDKNLLFYSDVIIQSQRLNYCAKKTFMKIKVLLVKQIVSSQNVWYISASANYFWKTKSDLFHDPWSLSTLLCVVLFDILSFVIFHLISFHYMI